MSNSPHRRILFVRVQREQILASTSSDLDPGPPEAHFTQEPTEFRDETEKELQHVRRDKARLEAELQAAREQVAPESDCFFVAQRSAFVLSAECLYLARGDLSLCQFFFSPYKRPAVFVFELE